MDDDPLGAAPDDLPEDDPTPGDQSPPTTASGHETAAQMSRFRDQNEGVGGADESVAGVVAAAEALVEAAARDVDLDATAADLDGVDAALRRLDDGTYGTCEVCSVDLDDDVLAANPTTRRCPAHVLAPTLPGTGLPPAPPAG